jgi:hypothetical protein
MNLRLFCLCAAFLAAPPLFARKKTDVIVMKNGDHITCEIKGMDSDTLYISVDYILSTLSVDWSKVHHIESNQLFMVKTQDGLVYSGTLSMAETPGGRPMKIEVLETPEKKATLEKGQIRRLDETSDNFWRRFNGEIGAGFTYSKGNQSTQYSLSSDVLYPRERWNAGASYNSNLTSNSGASTSTRNEVSVTARRLLRWNNWYYSGLADFLQSSEQGIQLQSTFGGGIGRYIKNTDHTTITVLGGFAWQQINYQKAIVPANSESVTSGLIGANLNLFYFNKTTLSVSAQVLPAISDPGRVHYTLNASYYVKLWSNLKWNITMYGNWDTHPPPGFSGSDYGSSSGLSWTFGNR